MLDWLLELLYPTRCAFCHQLIQREGEKVCSRCQKQLPRAASGLQLQHFPHLEVCVSPLYYEGDVRQSLLRYKFAGLTGYAEIYSEILAKSIDENQISCDIITWVPVSRLRLRRRGYDQAELLARALSARLGIPCVRTAVKIRNNRPQSSTGNAEKRRSNVKGVYRACLPEKLQGKRLLLVDDIVTTGATLSECAATLKRAGAGSVSGITLARKRN